MDDSARQIRKRIIKIILGAFLSVILVTLLIVLTITGIATSNSLSFPPIDRLPLFTRLEGYYIGHGSWEGVKTLPGTGNITLLDANHRIVLDRGANDTANVGTVYQSIPQEFIVNLKVGGTVVGSMVFGGDAALPHLGIIINILFPVSLISIFLTLLAAVLVVLLSRRIVTPLAEVIAASRAVTEGKLDTRVQVQGTQDLLVLTDSFNQMAASLEQNNRERRDLLADIAHELRTPISAIRGRLEGMLDGVYPADEHHISLALKANYLLERLVEDLRLLTLAEARQLQFEKKEIDLKALSAHCLEMFSAEAQEKGIQLELLPARGSYTSTLDPQRTEQVIGNLLGNALRYTPAGGRIWMALEQTDNNIAISICDTGTGVPEADLPFIFNRFWRKDRSRARQSGGSGLGLAIARQLIEAQGGAISAENRQEGGLMMIIRVPSDD